MRVLIVVLLFLFADATVVAQTASQEIPQTPQIKSEQKTNSSIKNKNSATQEASASFSNPHAKNSSANTDDGGDKGTEFLPPIFGARVKITDSLLVLFTFILAIFTGLLWSSTKALVEGAEDTAERQLRAYVTARGHAAIAAPPFGNPVRYGEPRRKIQAEHKVVIQITMKNTGQTPAKDVHVTSDIKLVDWPINPKELTHDLKNPDPNETHGSQDNLGAREELMFSMALDNPLTQADIGALERKEKAVVVYGVITYKDVFGLVLRKTNFRFNIGGAWGIKGCNVTTDNEGNDMT